MYIKGLIVSVYIKAVTHRVLGVRLPHPLPNTVLYIIYKTD